MITQTLIVLGVLWSPVLGAKKTVTFMTVGRNPVFDNGLVEIDIEQTEIPDSTGNQYTLTLEYGQLKMSDPVKFAKAKDVVSIMTDFESPTSTPFMIAIRDCEPTPRNKLRTWRFIKELNSVKLGESSVTIMYRETEPISTSRYIRGRFYVMSEDDQTNKKYPIIHKSEIEFNVILDMDNIYAFGDFRNLEKEEARGTTHKLKELINTKFSGYKVYFKQSLIVVEPLKKPVWVEFCVKAATLDDNGHSFEISFSKKQYVGPDFLTYRMKVMRFGDSPSNHASLLEFNCTGYFSSALSEFQMNVSESELLVNHKALNKYLYPTIDEISKKIEELIVGNKGFVVVNLLATTIPKETEQNLPDFLYLENISLTAGAVCLTIKCKTTPYVLRMPKHTLRVFAIRDSDPEKNAPLLEFDAYESNIYSTIQMTIANEFDVTQLAYCLQDWLEGNAFIAVKKKEEKTWKMLMPPLDGINYLGSGVASRDIINPLNGSFHSREKCDWSKKTKLPALFIDKKTFEKLRLLPNNCSTLFRVQLCAQYFQCSDFDINSTPEDLRAGLNTKEIYCLVDKEYKTTGITLPGKIIRVETIREDKEEEIGGQKVSVPLLPAAIQQLAFELIIFAKERCSVENKSLRGTPETCTLNSQNGTVHVKRRVRDDSIAKTVFIDVNNTLINCRSKQVEGWSKYFSSDSQKAGMYMEKFLALRENLYKDLCKLCQPYGEYQCVPYSSASEAFINILLKAVQEKGHFFKEPLTKCDAVDRKKDITDRTKNRIAFLLDNDPEKGKFNDPKKDNLVIGVQAFGTNNKIDAQAASRNGDTTKAPKFETFSEIVDKLTGRANITIKDNKIVKTSLPTRILSTLTRMVKWH